MSKKVFTTTGREEVPFSIDGTDYVLRQATGAAARKYREASFAGTEMEMSGDGDDEKRVMRRMQGIAGVESLLVAECCFAVLSNTSVPQSQIEAWPGDIQKWAFDEVKRISPWLDEKGDGKDVERLKKQRDKIDERIKKLEITDPKA